MKVSKVLLLVLVVFSVSVSAKQYGSVVVSDVISVYDGDTFRVNIAEYPAVIGENIRVRLKVADTPEIRGRCEAEKALAIKARDFVRTKLETAKVVRLNNIERGNYFRLIADVDIDGVSLSDLLIEEGLAVVYKGKRYDGWCAKVN